MSNEAGNQLGLGIALNDALEGDEVDPSARALMEKQVRMLDLQMKSLRKETAQLGVKFLRERLHAGFELAIAVAVGAALLLVAGMLFSASRAEGLVIQPFATPPDLAERGLSGAVLANRLSDGLGEIEAMTSSVRAGGPVRATQRQEVKVQIPKTGLSVGELQALLRGWLGDETLVSGELVREGERISLTVRVGDKPGATFYGPEGELDLLVRKAAEHVLARTEPYRYAVYLATQNKRIEALTVAEGLAVNGSPTDRAWGYAMWSRLLASEGDFAGASAKARRSRELDPDIAASHDNLAAAQRLLGHDQQALAASRDTLAVMRRQQRRMDKVSGPSRLATAEARVLEGEADYGGAARFYADAVRAGGVAHAGQAAASLPRALAFDHDIAGARRALEDLRGQLPEDALADAAVAPGLVASQAGAWPQAETLLLKAEATALMFGPAGAVVRRTQIAPALAYAQAMNGGLDGARATLSGTPADCYPCVRVRAVIAGMAGERAEAERLFRAAVALAPALPAAHLDWARMRLAAGDLDGAAEQARKAAALAPAWSDPLVVWGEALVRKGDLRGAAMRFRQAATLSPKWGLPPLRRAQALAALGQKREAARLLVQARGLSLTRAQQAQLAKSLQETKPSGREGPV